SSGRRRFSPPQGVQRKTRPRLGEQKIKQLDAQDVVAAVGEMGVPEIKGPEQDEGEHAGQAGAVSDQIEKGDDDSRVVHQLEKPGLPAQVEQGEDAPGFLHLQEGIVGQKAAGSPQKMPFGIMADEIEKKEQAVSDAGQADTREQVFRGEEAMQLSDHGFRPPTSRTVIQSVSSK